MDRQECHQPQSNGDAAMQLWTGSYIINIRVRAVELVNGQPGRSSTSGIELQSSLMDRQERHQPQSNGDAAMQLWTGSYVINIRVRAAELVNGQPGRWSSASGSGLQSWSLDKQERHHP
jgi:DNA polymerase/3'-5' exonuclease PolX